MSKVLISTSLRYTKAEKPSGRLLVYDLNKKVITKSCKIIEPPYREYDPNPRGGFRGLKGISIHENRIAIANASTIFLYDNTWEPLGYIYHPSCAGIHDIHLLENSIWVTSSRNDLLFQLDFNGNIINYIDVRDVKIIKKNLNHRITPFLSETQIKNGLINFRDPRTHDHAITDALHVNSFHVLNNGEFLVSCGLLRKINARLLHKINNLLKQTVFSSAYSKVYRLYRELLKSEDKSNLEDVAISNEESLSVVLHLLSDFSVKNCFVVKKCFVPSHSIRLVNDHQMIYLNSSSGELININLINAEILMQEKVGKKFLRGAVVLEDNSVLLGDNNELVHFDISNKRIISRTLISEDPAEAIFDIDILPGTFSLPPESFVEHHEKHFPVDQKCDLLGENIT